MTSLYFICCESQFHAVWMGAEFLLSLQLHPLRESNEIIIITLQTALGMKPKVHVTLDAVRGLIVPKGSAG